MVIEEMNIVATNSNLDRLVSTYGWQKVGDKYRTPCKFGFTYGPEDDAYMTVGNHEISIDGSLPRFFQVVHLQL